MISDLILNYIFYIDILIYNYFSNLDNSNLDLFSRVITKLGDTSVVILVITLFTIYLLKKKLYEWIFFFYFSVISSQIITYCIKIISQRPRPLNEMLIQNNFSFPSGHATIAVSLYLFIGFYFYSKRYAFERFKNIRIIIIALTIIFVLGVGLSRIFLNVHYFSDVLVGYSIGFFGFYLGKYLLEKYQ